MTFILPGRKPTIIPEVPRIDRGSMFARGLKFLPMIREPFYDVAGSRQITHTQNGSFEASKYGSAQESAGAGSGDNLAFTHPLGTPAAQVANPLTLAFVAQLDAVSTRAGIYQHGLNAGNGGIYVIAETFESSWRFSVENWNANFATVPYAIGPWQSLVCTYDPVSNAVDIYCNGEKGTGATEAAPNTEEEITAYLADAFVGFDREVNGRVAFFAQWDRIMPEAEAKAFSRGENFLSIFERQRRTYFLPAAGAGPTFQAAWARAAQSNIGLA